MSRVFRINRPCDFFEAAAHFNGLTDRRLKPRAMEEKIVKEMSKFEIWSLILTGIYDLLTFLLLSFTVYIAVFQRRVPNIALFYQVVPKDTKHGGWASFKY